MNKLIFFAFFALATVLVSANPVKRYTKDEALAKAKAIQACIVDNRDQPNADKEVPKCILALFDNEITAAKEAFANYVNTLEQKARDFFVNTAYPEVKAFYLDAKAKLSGAFSTAGQYIGQAKDTVSKWVSSTLGRSKRYTKDEALAKAKAIQACIVDNRDQPNADKEVPKCILALFDNEITAAKEAFANYVNTLEQKARDFFVNTAYPEVKAFYLDAKAKLSGAFSTAGQYIGQAKDTVSKWVSSTLGRSKRYTKDEALAKAKAIQACIVDNKDKPESDKEVPKCILALFDEEIAAAKAAFANYVNNLEDKARNFFINTAYPEVRAFYLDAKAKLSGAISTAGQYIGQAKDTVNKWVSSALGRSKRFTKDDALAKAKAIQACIVENRDKPDADKEVPKCVLALFDEEIAAAKVAFTNYINNLEDKARNFFINTAYPEVKAFYLDAKNKINNVIASAGQYIGTAKDVVSKWVSNTVG